jgi:hypothetical protein
MSFISGVKAFGHGIEKVFGWMTSPKGQAVIAAGEAVVETVVPNSIPLVDLFNEWAKKAFTVEALAVSASQATGTGADKAALAISSITPQVLAYAQQEGLSPRTATQIQAANDAAVAFIKAMTDEPVPAV